METHLLEVENLKTQFKTEAGLVNAVDGVSFHLKEGEIIAVVGESGCGKSVTQLSVMRLIRSPGRIIGGRALFQGQDLLTLPPNGEVMRSIRGSKIAMIFQEPMTSLNPVLSICQQMTEMLQLHLKMDDQTAKERAIELIRRVGIPDSQARINEYPHQFSGGMRQRVMIAMALSCTPRILIADEPTTAVDVTTQAQLLEIMKEMVQHFSTSLIIVTHNLGIVARYAERIYVMYAGRIIESGPSEDIFFNSRHPYTIGLLNCVPRLDQSRKRKIVPISGMPPNLINMSGACAFLPRCNQRTEQCGREPWPELKLINGEHYAACYVDVRSK
jgi:peptide/nickel transport system ATP-binding protein